MDHTFIGSLVAAGSVAALICAAPASAQAGDETQFSIPAQDLSASLREVSTRTGRNVIAPSELVRGRRAPAVSGPFTAEGAVRLLLTGSGLDVRAAGDAIVIFRPADASAGSAAVGVAATEEEAIVVTGTNIRGARPTSPTIIIGRQEMDRIGATSVDQLMRTVPQNTQGGVNRGNFGAPLAGGDQTDHGAGLNLRGLGQRATLVLVNGRRLAPSGGGSFVDVSLIPLTAVERVEILTDGASAIYGSDAVGGVVNFILRDRYAGAESLVQAGTTTQGDGDQLQLGQTLGHAWSSGSAMLAYEFRLEDEVRARDRDFTINLRPEAFLLPRERRHSLLGVVRQELASGLEVELTGTFARRHSDRTFYFLGSPLPVGQDARARARSMAGELRYELGGGWLARLDGLYSLSTTSQSQTQPGGSGLVNARDTRNEIAEGGLRLDGPLIELPGGAMRLAIGGVARRETYSDIFSTSSFVFPRENRRSVRAGYGELLIPLFSPSNRRPGVERLQISAAGRWEHYSQFGSTFDPRIGLLWSPLRDLALRGAWGTSYRAPLLSESIGTFNGIYFPASFVYLNPAQAQGVALVLQGGDPDIGPETSRTWTLGADFTPQFVPGLRLTANHYSIRFSNRIAVPTSAIRVIGNPAFEPIVRRSPTQAEVAALVGAAQIILDFSGPGFSNGGATPADVTVVLDNRTTNTAITTTSGFDFGLNYSFAVGENRLRIDANLNHILDFTDRLTVASAPSRVLDTTYRPLDWRARGAIGWSRGGTSANLFVNHADSYRDTRGGASRPVASHTTFDLSLAHEFGGDGESSWLRGTRIALYAENLFDRDPPRLVPDPGQTSGLGYDPVNANGRGRLISFQIRRSW